MKLDPERNKQEHQVHPKDICRIWGQCESKGLFRRLFGNRILMGLAMLLGGQSWESHLHSQNQRDLTLVDLEKKSERDFHYKHVFLVGS